MPVMQATPDIADRISAKLRKLMDARPPISQKSLAGEIGIPTMVLNRAINGTATPTAEAIIKIAVYYGITTDELLGVRQPRRRKSAV